MSGIYYGEEDRSALDEPQVYAAKVGLLITVPVGIIVFIAARYIAGVYVFDAIWRCCSKGGIIHGHKETIY